MSIKINHVSHTYNKKTNFAFKALDDVSFEIKEGSYTCIIGETGSGKSTLIQHLNGLLKPDEGFIEIADHILNSKKQKDYKSLRKNVGLVFQFPESQLFEETVLKDVCFGLKNFGYSNEEAEVIAKETLLKLGIQEEMFLRSPFELSGGERRRVALAGVFAIKPKILILDEPTVGLDPVGAKEILSIIKDYNNQGTTIILVSHDMDVIFKYASDIVMLSKGKVSFAGSRDDFFNNYPIELDKPFLLRAIHKFKEKNVNIDLRKVHSAEELVEELKKQL